MRITMEQHKAEYRARPLSARLHDVFTATAQQPLRRVSTEIGANWQPSKEIAVTEPVPCSGCGATGGHQRCPGCFHNFHPAPAKAYKPTHGGYPG